VLFLKQTINLKYAMPTNDYDLAPIGALIKDMKYHLRVSSIEASVVYAPRYCNKPAHELAALGNSSCD
jgi:hypothetical protein